MQKTQSLSSLFLQLSPPTVKLRGIYSWELPQAFHETHSDEDEIEAVNNDNYIAYVQRLLEFSLDKGIRAQMEAFVGELLCNHCTFYFFFFWSKINFCTFTAN